jgi:hypothetical protein
MRANTLDAKQLEIDGQGASGGSNPNLIINGNFDIWQRGTTYDYSVQSTRYDTADRWMMRSTASSDVTISQQIFTVGQTVVPGNPTYFLRWDITSYTEAFGKLQQRIENVRVVSGQDVTVSFWAKADSACDITVSMLQDFGTSGSSDVETTPVAKTLSTSWQKFTETITVPSVSGKTISGGDDFLAIGFGMPQAARTVDFAQVKVEIGSVATPFQPRSIGEELALCQRYFYYPDRMFGFAQSATTIVVEVPHPVEMRSGSTASVAVINPYTECGIAQVEKTPTSMGMSWARTAANVSMVQLNGFSGLTAGINASIDRSIHFDAEL